MEDDAEAPPAVTQPKQVWDAESYANNGRFVAHLASAVVELLAAQPGERVLDVGCGDGALTEHLASSGAIVTGIDASETMVQAARARGLEVNRISATDLTYDRQFDAVFSNAALHWIPESDQITALTRIRAALKPGGRFVGEMGGLGNIAAIRTALSATLAPFGIDAEASAASYFPSKEVYSVVLEQAGFAVKEIDLIPRPTPLPGGTQGMELWLETFRNGLLASLGSRDKVVVVERVVSLLRPILWDQQSTWHADYVRLRFSATRIG